MLPSDRARFPPISVVLKDSRSLTVRLLAPADGEALAEFYQGVPWEDYRFYCPHPLTREQALRKAQHLADAENFVCVVGVDAAGQIVGYAWYHWNEADSPSSSFGICISRTYQGSGTGQALMRHLFEVAHEIGPAHMHLTVQMANPSAVRLYQKMGFVIVREQMRSATEEFPAEPEFRMERCVRETKGEQP